MNDPIPPYFTPEAEKIALDAIEIYRGQHALRRYGVKAEDPFIILARQEGQQSDILQAGRAMMHFDANHNAYEEARLRVLGIETIGQT